MTTNPPDPLHRLFENSCEVCLLVVDGRIGDCNPAAEKALGRPTKEILAAKPEDLGLREIASGSEPSARHEWTYEHPDGRTLIFDVAATSMELDGKPARLLMASDLTQMHATQEHLIGRHQILQDALESCSDGICAYEAIRDNAGRPIDFQCILANPAALKLMQTQAKEGWQLGTLLEFFRRRRRTARSPAWSMQWRRANRSATSGGASCRMATSGSRSPLPSCRTAC